MIESKFQREFMRALPSAFIFNVCGSTMQTSGIPDLYIAHPQWHGWVELKTNKRRVMPLQKVKIKELLARGVAVLVIRHKGNIISAEWEGRVIYSANWHDKTPIVDFLITASEKLGQEFDLYLRW